MAEKKKRYPFWYESMEGLGRIDDEIRKMMGDLSVQMPKVSVTFPKVIPIQFSEDDKEILARAELPGFSKDEVKLKVTSGSMDISAQKKRVSEDRGKNFFRQESSYGAARRVVPLPAEVSTDDVKAKFENGVLSIALRKKASSKKVEKKINID